MYKVSKTQTNKRSKLTTITQIGLILAIFGTVFFLYQAVATMVYGYDFNMTKGPYAEVMNATLKAANMTEGTSIKYYIENVSDQICMTMPHGKDYVATCIVKFG